MYCLINSCGTVAFGASYKEVKMSTFSSRFHKDLSLGMRASAKPLRAAVNEQMKMFKKSITKDLIIIDKKSPMSRDAARYGDDLVRRLAEKHGVSKRVFASVLRRHLKVYLQR
jgi:hypothetical protein